MNDRIAKQRLNVILLVDTSTSMRGERISQVNKALKEIKKHLINMQAENVNVDFYISLITFATEARFYNNHKFMPIEQFDAKDIWAGGWSNLHFAYESLEDILKKESKGGIMQDFGGVAPIILLLTDGHPTGNTYKDESDKLKQMAWFKVALRYGIAIELKDDRTINVLRDFVGNNGDVIDCYDAKLLERIIKIIVLTASKVKSTSIGVQAKTDTAKGSINQVVQQQITEALSDTENWEW